LLADNENPRIELRLPEPADAVVLHGYAIPPSGQDGSATMERKPQRMHLRVTWAS